MNMPEQYRVSPTVLNTNIFSIPYKNHILVVQASVDAGWNHVSVSLKNRNPNWEEMCFIKNLFFGPESLCVQFHPRASDYINMHEYCLHIWEPPTHVEKVMDQSFKNY